MRPTTALSLARCAAGSWRILLARAPDDADDRRVRAAAIYEGFRPVFAHVPVVAARSLGEALARGGAPLLVDVREAHERLVSTLPGAITATDFLADPRAHRGRTVVAFCTLGVRSGAWAAERVAEGHAVHNLHGGLLAWAHEGGELVTPDGADTRRLHVYGARWNLVPEGYEGVW